MRISTHALKLCISYNTSITIDTHLPAELAEILRVLADLHLFNLLPQTSTVSGACRKKLKSKPKSLDKTDSETLIG